jgi:hypothetical protein
LLIDFDDYDKYNVGGDETAKTIAVLDIEKVNMSFLSGDPFVHLKRTLSAANAHYPERSKILFHYTPSL